MLNIHKLIIKSTIKIIPVLLLLSFICQLSHSGETNSGYISLGAGYSCLGMRDRGLSPLYYSGSHVNLNSSYHNRTASRSGNLEINFLIGDISPAIYHEMTSSEIKNIKTTINYSYLRFINYIIREQGELLLGGAWESQFAYYKHNQFENSSANNFFLNTLNLSGAVSYPVNKNDQKLLMMVQVNLPLLAFIVRPSFAYIKPKGFLDHSRNNLQSFLNSIEISSFNRFTGLNSLISIEYKLNNNHSLRIGYKWEYWSHKSLNIIETATHGLMLQTMFNL